MQGFAGPSHCSCISRFHRLRGLASSQSFSCGHLAPAGCLVRRQRAGRGRPNSPSGTITITGRVRTQHIRDAPSNTSLAVVGLSGCRRAPGRLAVLYVVPLFVPETQLPASDSPRSPVLPTVACQPAPARGEGGGGGAVSHSRFPGPLRSRTSLADRDGDASLANRPWSRPAWPARQTGLEEPPLPGVLQIDEPDACVALAHLGTANALPVPRRPMQMHAGGQTGRRLPFTASCPRHVLNLYISAKVLLSGTVLVPRRRTSRATRCGA